MMRILIFLVLCSSCIPRESSPSKDTSTAIESMPLAKFAIGLPKNDGNLAAANAVLKCDSLLKLESYEDHYIVVTKFDHTPLWSDPIKKVVVASLNFADTATILAMYSSACNSDLYSELRFQNRSVYTLRKNISAPDQYGAGMADVYFRCRKYCQ
jgi:hypothetical protein